MTATKEISRLGCRFKPSDPTSCPICGKVVTHLIDQLYYCSKCDEVIYDGGER